MRTAATVADLAGERHPEARSGEAVGGLHAQRVARRGGDVGLDPAGERRVAVEQLAGDALGVGGVNNAYTVANTVPNALYDLLLGGVLSALVVPLLVRAAHDDPDGGDAYAQRLVTIVAVVLTAVAVVAVIAAPAIISLYAHNARPAQ